ncbi:aminotransferase class I/II-fold pyridoxal phosphate-dependent enzyme [Ectothiorhodospiraceae bacterium BW-2]|nr:aminotransferase class I/II-fold pyridoxal phosphate-dependent enzyme [Ectothiorhodospiraceae bacterium BW-2]
MARQFEQALADLTGAKHAIVCANGTTALHLACLGLKIETGDLGLTSPITFLSSANCVEFCGGRSDFIDIDMASLSLSPEKLELYCETVAIPKVVIPVDFAGVAADLPTIYALSKKYGFYVIEDAAHSIGTTYKDDSGIAYQCGSCAHTDAAIFSFHPVKTITTGEGGGCFNK